MRWRRDELFAIRGMLVLGLIWIGLFTSIADASPSDVESLVTQAHQSFVAGNYTEARRRLEQAARIEPSHASVWKDLGVIDTKLGDTQLAISAYKKAQALDPADATTYFNLGLLYSGRSDFKEALIMYRAGLQINPDDAGANAQYGALLLREKRYSEALLPLRQALTASPELAQAHAQLGLALLGSKTFEDATAETGRAVQLAPDSVPYSLQLMEALLQWRHYKTALDLANALQKNLGSLPQFRLDLARADYGLARYDTAIEELEPLLEGGAGSDQAHTLLGLCLMVKGAHAEAEAQFREALKLNPSAASTYSAIGQALRLEAGRDDEAIGYLRKALQLDPADQDAKFALALCLTKQLQFSQAETLLRELEQANPTNLRVHETLARIYFQTGKTAEASAEKRSVETLRKSSTLP